ncbi:MAG: hypothetical protein WC109_08555 [Syntrophomonadaceae bacterium]
MSDIRIRLLTLVLLSVLSFVSTSGAAVVFFWWLVFAAKTTFAKKSWKVVLLTSVLVGLFPSVVLYFTGGDVFYGAKIFVLVLLAFWFSASLVFGEVMSLFVWMFGKKTGFDLGLAAEFSIQALSEIQSDFSHMKSALKIKGQRFSVFRVPSLAMGLLFLSLGRSDFQSGILARRGYISGGTFIPVFFPGKSDFLMLVTAGILYAVLLV